MDVRERLRQLRGIRGILSTQALERHYTLFKQKYRELEEDVRSAHGTSIFEGDIVLSEMKDVELEEQSAGVRTMSAFTLNIFAINRTLVFHPWGLTQQYPIWGMVRVFPLGTLYMDTWLGLFAPNKGSEVELSQWVSLGPEMPSLEKLKEETAPHGHPMPAINGLIDALITAHIGADANGDAKA